MPFEDVFESSCTAPVAAVAPSIPVPEPVSAPMFPPIPGVAPSVPIPVLPGSTEVFPPIPAPILPTSNFIYPSLPPLITPTPPTPSVTTATSIFPPLPPLPLDSGPSFIDQLDNSSQLSDIENEIIAQTLLSANVKQKKKTTDSQPKDSLPPLFRARLLDTPGQSIEGEVIYVGGSIEGVVFPDPMPINAAVPIDLPISSFSPDLRRTKTLGSFQRAESIDLIGFDQQDEEPKALIVVDPQPLIIIDPELKRDKVPPVVVDDKLLAAVHRDPSVSKSKRSSKSRHHRKHHQFSRANVVAPMEFDSDSPQQLTERIYKIEEHIPESSPCYSQLDLVSRGAEAPSSERVRLSETTTTQHRSLLARSTTVAEEEDHNQRIQKLKSSNSTPGDRRMLHLSESESLASSSSGVDENLYTATRVMPRSEPQRMSSTTSSSSTCSGSQAIASFVMPSNEQQPAPFVAPDPVVVFHISGSNTNDEMTSSSRLPSSPMLSTKLMMSTNNKRPMTRHTTKMASITTVGKVKRFNVMTASKGNRNRSPRREIAEHSLSSTSSRIDQAKADHFQSPASPAVLNLSNLLGGGDTEPPVHDEITGDI